MTTVLKLGGSVITRKDERETVDETALPTAADIISGALASSPGEPRATEGGQSLVVVHGGGSFGHPAASGHGVSAREGTTDAATLVDIHRAMGRLNDRVVAELHGAGVPALPVRPLSMARRTDGEARLGEEVVEAMLAEGFVPVLHGDVVVHGRRGGTVCSGDTLVVALAKSLDADRLGVCSTVPGVLDGADKVIPEITGYGDVADVLGESNATDVTGGMAGKVRELLDVAVPASIFGLDDLETFFETGRAGTTVR